MAFAESAGIRGYFAYSYFAYSSEILTSSLPKFSPRMSHMKAPGAFSSPSTTSSRYLMRPSLIHPAIR